MTKPLHDEIETTRLSIVGLMSDEFSRRSGGAFDAYDFGNAVAPLVNALAALALIEKQDHRSDGPGVASRSDD